MICTIKQEPICSQTTHKGLCSCGGITTMPLQTGDTLFYNGPNLPGTGIQTCDKLNVALAKIDAKLLSLAEDMVLIKAQLNI